MEHVRSQNIINSIMKILSEEAEPCKTMLDERPRVSLAKLFLLLNERNVSEVSIRELLKLILDLEVFCMTPPIFIEFDGETFWVRKGDEVR